MTGHPSRPDGETFIPSAGEGQNMSDRDSGEDLSRLVAELVTTLEDLEDELEPPDERPLRPPTPSEMRRFTSDVAIPGLILILESNIRALRLLQRALRLSEGADRTRRETEELGARARDVSETTLDRLDSALAELQDAVEARPGDDEAADLLADARELRSEVQTRLREYADDAADRARNSGDEAVDIPVDGDEDAEAGDGAEGSESSEDGNDEGESDEVGVDVDAELESIKREIDGDENGAGSDGDTPADEVGAGNGASEDEATEDAGGDDAADEPGADAHSDAPADGDTEGGEPDETPPDGA